MIRCRVSILSALVLVLISSASWIRAAAAITWQSVTTGGEMRGELRSPQQPASPRDAGIPTVIYLKNLSIPRLGGESDESIITDLLQQGMLVLTLDYQHHPLAISPNLAADVLKLREELGDKNRTLLKDHLVDLNHVFILPEGFRLRRDVEFARDGARVLAIDVMYPSQPEHALPALIEFSCDNANRMGNSSLVFCHDTLLEGGALAGFAVAMADHPMPPPYKGLDDPIRECVERSQAAVRTQRSLSPQLGLNGKVGAIGFSRGGPYAAILAATGKVTAALIHGNRYDYLDLLPDDPMLPRLEKAWGRRERNEKRWAEHSAAFYLTKGAAPMFLNTSNAESPEYRKGLSDFDRRLTELGVDHVYQLDDDERGHRVSTNPKTLAAIYAFFHKHLDQ